MTFKAQQIKLDNALVAPENRRVIGKCNMRINPGMKLKEPTYQFWATVTKHKASYRFKIDNKKYSVNVEVFIDILNICPRIPGKEFDEPPSEEEALSFIRELGHSREIKYITDVIVDHLHQQWRTFASIINKCLCGKKKSTKAKKVTATKPKPSKKKAPVKADKGKGFNVVSEVALSEAAQLKEATKQSKKDFHISQASGSGTDEGTGTKPGVPNVPKYDSENEKESWGDSGEEYDDDEDDTKDDEGNDATDDNKDSDGNDDDGNDDDGNDGDGDDDDDANDDDKQEDDDTNDDDKETDSDRTESDRIKIPVLNQSST
ncbi:hypothetical protein Tco_1437365 [Tanacetum coccineum]